MAVPTPTLILSRVVARVPASAGDRRRVAGAGGSRAGDPLTLTHIAGGRWWDGRGL